MFWKLLQESVITQAVLTLMVWGTIIALYLMGKTPSPELLGAGVLVLGFFFGAKTQRAKLDTTSTPEPPKTSSFD